MDKSNKIIETIESLWESESWIYGLKIMEEVQHDGILEKFEVSLRPRGNELKDEDENFKINVEWVLVDRKGHEIKPILSVGELENGVWLIKKDGTLGFREAWLPTLEDYSEKEVRWEEIKRSERIAQVLVQEVKLRVMNALDGWCVQEIQKAFKSQSGGEDKVLSQSDWIGAIRIKMLEQKKIEKEVKKIKEETIKNQGEKIQELLRLGVDLTVKKGRGRVSP